MSRTAGAALGALAALLLVLVSAPAASAHAATEPLSIETHALSDEASGVDAFFYVDGYDLYNAYVREAYHAPTDEEGVIWRFDLYGGFGPASTHSELHVDVGVGSIGEGPSARITTTDDRNWTSETATIAFQNTTGDRDPPFTGFNHLLQVFVPYEALGVEAGGTLETPWMRSWAGSDPVDDAPGGYYAPAGGGAAEVPDAGQSERLADEVPLTGPRGYVDVEVDATGNLVNVTVASSLEETGQHVQLEVPDAAGWRTALQGAPETVLEPGERTSFLLNATPDGAVDPLPLRVVSDLGGLHRLSVATPDLAPAAAGGPTVTVAEADEAPETQETPVPSALALVALVGAAAAAGSRRE